jgi:hypothetical protein
MHGQLNFKFNKIKIYDYDYQKEMVCNFLNVDL